MLTLTTDLGNQYPTPNSKTKAHYGLYDCSCGSTNNRLVISMVKTGRITECLDCKERMLVSKLGKNYSKLKKVWFYMIERCYNPEHSSYHNYGGKGIKVCDEWRDSFEAFEEWALNNGYTEEPAVTLDKDFMAWVFDRQPEYSPRGCIFLPPSKNSTLRRLTK
jgi:hypothetical protein